MSETTSRSLQRRLAKILRPSLIWKERYQESIENVSALASVIELIQAADSFSKAISSALAAVRTAFGWQYASFWQIDPDADELRFAVESGEVNPEFAEITRRSSFRRGVGLSGRVWEQEDVLFVPDIGDVSDCCRAPVARTAGVRSGICFPIYLNGSVIGTMDFFTNQRIELSDSRLEVFRAVGKLVSATLQKLHEIELQTEARQNSNAISDVIRAISSAETCDHAVRMALDAVRQSFNWNYGSFWRMSPGGTELRFEVESGTVSKEFRDVTLSSSFAKGVGLSGRAWSTRSLQFTPDIGEVRDCCRAPAAKRAGVRAGVCFPVILSGEVQGTMDFFSTQTFTLSKGRLDALQLVADLVSQTLGRIMDNERTKKRSAGLHEGVQEVLVVVEAATKTMSQLDRSGSEIGGVIKLIGDIAEQTNLLALNATIEAARAGTAGKGFAVVAQEVKTLSQETSKSANDISVRIDSIRNASRGAIAAIEEIGRVMNEIQME